MSEIKIKRKKITYNPIINITINTVIGNILFVIFICLSAVIITKYPVNSELLFLFIITSSSLGSLFSGFLSARKAEKNKLLTGCIASIMLTIIHFIIILCFNNASLAMKTYIIFPCDIITGIIGTIAGINLIRR